MTKQKQISFEASAIHFAERDIVLLHDKLEIMHKLIESGKHNNIEFAKRIAREYFINRKNTIHFKLLDCIEKCSKIAGIPHVFKNSKSSWSPILDNAGKQIIEQDFYDSKTLRRLCDAVDDALILAKRDILKVSSRISEQEENE